MQLKAENVSFRYGNNTPLFENVTLEVNEDEIVGIVAPSGFGKTTLCKILAGYESPSTGEVTLGGSPLPVVGYHPVQLVFQHPEKAINPRWKMGQVLSESGEQDQEILQMLGIQKEWLKRWPNELSGGELQRFCIARALASHTRFLIADEMTTMLDAITQAQIWQAVMEIAKKRKIGIIVVSHDESLIQKLCQRVIRLNVNEKEG
ncbi:ABC transporter ATP-binding protein [Sutcliffiella cohnii]|uniref:ABC transporter ATP-binding protein n=1 Tax=Sutcliffiella cohnii TaxID=33932 RepID=A0A223KMS2_9BACI|nr:ATP-binding cassette domain-containing protein [Sutcliffiella cohnii]AST90696.1 ABC transporter ATP-binding protein [Sutcliffiella cohnii]